MEWVAALLAEGLLGPDFDLEQREHSLYALIAGAVTDCKSLYDAVLAPGLTWFSKRLKQEMLVPLSQIEGVRASPTKEARWCFTVTFEPDAAAPAGSSGEEEGQGPPRQPLSELKLVCQNMDEYNCWVVGIQALVAVSRAFVTIQRRYLPEKWQVPHRAKSIHRIIP